MSAQVDVVVTELDRIACASEIPYPHWIGGDEADQGPSYCFDCATAQVKAGKAEYVDGGWQQDSDGCCHCEDCGRLLDYTLTDYGVEEELAHFQSDRLRRKLTPEVAYHLARVLEQHEAHPKVLTLLPRVKRAIARASALAAVEGSPA